MNIGKKSRKLPLKLILEFGRNDSRTMKKLKRHCTVVAEEICSRMPLDRDLPGGYKVIIKPDIKGDPDYIKEKVLVNLKKHITVSESMSRDMVIFFSRDIAEGLLEKCEELLKEISESRP